MPYPVAAPFAEGRLVVGDGHEIAYWQYGNPQGRPAVYLHGGPGGGSDPAAAGLFNPEKYHVVLFDQRGCGKSTPHAELRANTTWDLVKDMELLRQQLGFEQWLVCGGSWGSTLALAYAETHPTRTRALVLRGIFTLRRAELLWFYQEGASWLYPDLWEGFIAPIPPAERGDLISAYHRRLTGNDHALRLQCAKAWSGWEAATLSLRRDEQREQQFAGDDYALAFARIECHYFVNAGFFRQDGQLIANARQLAGIPGVIIQGRYDVVTPMQTAWDLHRQWHEAEFVIVADAGHAMTEAGISAAIVAATDKLS